ncbi:hypothetical protein JCM3765_007723 [Sporobolomyces pararoseus]
MGEQLSIHSSSIPPTDVRGLFEKYTYLASTPPNPSKAEPAIDTGEKSEVLSAQIETEALRIDECTPSASIPDSVPFVSPPIFSPSSPLPHPTAPPGVLQLSPASLKPLSWAPEISSVYRIKLLVARLAAFRLVKPLNPQSPTRSELQLIHSIIHYIRGLARGEDSIELGRDKAFQGGGKEKQDRIRNVQCVTLFRVLNQFHPEFENRVPGKVECVKIMKMVSEAVDDKRSFEELFDLKAFSKSNSSKKRERYFEEEEEEGDEDYQPYGQGNINKKKKKKKQDSAFDAKGKIRRSLRTQVLTRSVSKGSGSQLESLVDWD